MININTIMKIAIIKPNSIRYNETDLVRTNFTHEKTEDLLEDNIVYKTVTNDNEFMKILIDTLTENIPEGDNFLAFHTGIVRHVGDELYQICHVYATPELHDYIKQIDLKFNGISTYLTDALTPVFGNAVVFKIDTLNNENKLDTLTESNLIEIYNNKFIHKGVILNVDETIDETVFVFNPVDWISPHEIHKYKYVETELLDKVLMIFYDDTISKNPETINKIGSQLTSSQGVYGRLILGLHDQIKDSDNNSFKYADLSKDVMKDIISMICIRKEEKKMKEIEDTDLTVVNGKRIYNNFYKMLKNRLNVQQMTSSN